MSLEAWLVRELRFGHLEKFSLFFVKFETSSPGDETLGTRSSNSSFLPCVNLLHPCSFKLYCYLFSVLNLNKLLFSGCFQFKGYFVRGQNTATLLQTLLHVFLNQQEHTLLRTNAVDSSAISKLLFCWSQSTRLESVGATFPTNWKEKQIIFMGVRVLSDSKWE